MKIRYLLVFLLGVVLGARLGRLTERAFDLAYRMVGL